MWVHPRKQTWNLKMMVFNRNLLFQGLIFRFHVSFRGCNSSSNFQLEVFAFWGFRSEKKNRHDENGHPGIVVCNFWSPRPLPHHDAKWKVLWISLLHICWSTFYIFPGKKTHHLIFAQHPKSLKNCTSSSFFVTFLGWLSDPFKAVKWPPTRGWKGHELNHLAVNLSNPPFFWDPKVQHQNQGRSSDGWLLP